MKAFILGMVLVALALTFTSVGVRAAEGNQLMTHCSVSAGVASAAQQTRIESGDDKETMISTITALSEAIITEDWTGDQEVKRVTNLSMVVYAIRWVFQEYDVTDSPHYVYGDTMDTCLDEAKIEKMIPAPEGELTPNGKQAVEYTV